MDINISVALINLVGDLAWPVGSFAFLFYVFRQLRRGALNQILPHGGTLSYGDAKLEVRKDLQAAELSAEAVAVESNEEKSLPVVDKNLEPYDLVMASWADLADTITNLAMKYDGWDDRRQVWSNLEHLVSKSVISEAQMGAVRDLQKARNSIRRFQEIDQESASQFAETAMKLRTTYESIG